MQSWADYLDNLKQGAAVIPFPKRHNHIVKKPNTPLSSAPNPMAKTKRPNANAQIHHAHLLPSPTRLKTPAWFDFFGRLALWLQGSNTLHSPSG